MALSLLRAGLDRETVRYIGWFGPRGLASVVFALLAVEELGETPVVAPAIATVTLTVLLSVVLNGATAGPLGTRYARSEARRTRVGGNDAGADGAPRARRQSHGTAEC